MEKDTGYFKEKEKAFTPILAIEEASRCLLCYDAPCTNACPAGTDPAKFIRSLRFRNFKGAVSTIRENNILGGICARVCPTDKYCEGACSLCGIDRPIEIGKIQRFLTDYEQAIGFKCLETAEATKDKVAIIGSGPSGLSAAAKLSAEGYKVTVFESRKQLGGWLTYGIPENKLPMKVVENEIQYVKDLGVEFVLDCKVGKDITPAGLKKDGFAAILLATGMHKGRDIDIKGNDLKGVVNGIDFLAEAKTSGGNIKVGNKVVVIGGGDVAVDCASTAKLLGAEDVKIVYRRTMEKMPADREELAYLQQLNIPVFTGLKPAEVIGEYGKVTQFKAAGMFDDSKLILDADMVIFAIGQQPDESVVPADVNEKGIFKTCDYMTSVDGVFASGDIADGDKTVVYAVKEGKEAAESIINYLEDKKEGVK